MSSVPLDATTEGSSCRLFRLLPLFAIRECADKPDAGADAPTSDATAGPEASADIIVVGAGISGLTVARALVEDGRSVVVLGGRDRIGDPASDLRFVGTVKGEEMVIEGRIAWTDASEG